MPTRIELRRDTAANWASVNPILGPGEPALETDTHLLKFGDGSTRYASLPYAGNATSNASTLSTGTIAYALLPVGTTAGTVSAGNDARFTDARTPTAHHTTHQSGGTDAVTLAESQVTNLVADLAAKLSATAFTAKGQVLVATASGTYVAVAVGANGKVLTADSSQPSGVAWGNQNNSILLPFSYAGNLSIYTSPMRWYNDTGKTLTISTIRAALGTAPTGSSAIFDVLKNGSTIFTTTGNRPTVAISGHTATSGTPDDVTVLNGDYLTVNIAQVGSSVPGADLTLTVTMS